MLKTLVSIAFFVGVSAFGATAQPPGDRSSDKRIFDLPIPPAKPDPGTETVIIEIADNKTVRIAAIKGFESWGPGPANIKKALAEYQATRVRKPFQLVIPAVVVIRAAPSLDMRTVFEYLKIAREGASELSIEVTDHYSLNVPPEPKDQPETDVKPNPLFLLATLDEKGVISLNSERNGDIKDVRVIQSRLKELFSEREKNGVFRENSYEIEKSTFVRVPETARFADVSAFARALADTGADPLWLAIEKIGWIEDRFEMEDVDLPPIKRKGNTLRKPTRKRTPKRNRNR